MPGLGELGPQFPRLGVEGERGHQYVGRLVHPVPGRGHGRPGHVRTQSQPGQRTQDAYFGDRCAARLPVELEGLLIGGDRFGHQFRAGELIGGRLGEARLRTRVLPLLADLRRLHVLLRRGTPFP